MRWHAMERRCTWRRGGHCRDGTQQLVASTEQQNFSGAQGEEARFTEGTLPNSLSFADNGDILIASYGTDLLEQMSRSSETVTLHDNIDGKPMGKVNFILRDSKNRIWITSGKLDALHHTGRG